MTRVGRFLTIVWTDRDGLVRIVTAFDSPGDDQAMYLRERGNSNGNEQENRSEIQ